jgi:hypothetical protein
MSAKGLEMASCEVKNRSNTDKSVAIGGQVGEKPLMRQWGTPLC